MSYTPATSYPSLNYFQWATKDAPNPTLSAPLFPADTTIYFSSPPYDHNGAIMTGNFLMGVKNSESYVMTCYIPAGGVAVDGLSATVVQGVRLEGMDYSTSDISLIPEEGFSAGSAIFCNISGVIQALTIGAIRGTIATNGLGFVMGDGTASNATISHVDNVSTKGFLRKNPTTSKVQYSNDGTNWVNIDSVSASNLVQVSAGDTTPAYLETKLAAGSNIGITKKNSGGNEYLEIAATLPAGIVSPSTYSSAFLTGGTNAQGTFNNWLAVLDGSFRITIDGTLRNITGLNFTGVTSMNDVAAKIQTAIRALTGLTETVVWSTNKFVITSSLLTVTSAITVTSATGSGTDISGAGASDWMDCDTGHGVVTNSALNQAADSGKVVLLDTPGKINNQLIPTITDTMTDFTGIMTAVAGENIDGTTTPQAVCIAGVKKYVLTHGSSYLYNPSGFTVGSTNIDFGKVNTAMSAASQFTTPTTSSPLTLTNIVLPIYRNANPADNIVLEIYSDTGANLPNAVVTNGTSTITPSIASAGNQASFNFVFATPPVLLPNTKYWISVRRSSGTPDATNYYSIVGTATGGTFAFYRTDTAVWYSGGTYSFGGNIYYTEDLGGKIYKAAANDLAKGEFIGFVTSNVTTGQSVSIKTSGVISTTGLTTGSQYYLSTTVGAITASPTYALASALALVGIATSSTTLSISPSKDKIITVNPLSSAFTPVGNQGVSTGAVTVNVPLLFGFKPKKIHISLGQETSSSTGTAGYYDYTGTAMTSMLRASGLVPGQIVNAATTTIKGGIDTIMGHSNQSLKIDSINDLGASITFYTNSTTASYVNGLTITAEG